MVAALLLWACAPDKAAPADPAEAACTTAAESGCLE